MGLLRVSLIDYSPVQLKVGFSNLSVVSFESYIFLNLETLLYLMRLRSFVADYRMQYKGKYVTKRVCHFIA